MQRKVPDFNPHSPRGERPRTGAQRAPGQYFNPHSPRGERLLLPDSSFIHFTFQPTLPSRGATPSSDNSMAISLFQPTLPSRGATLQICANCTANIISTHTPLAGSDKNPGTEKSPVTYFNPHSPRGERHSAPPSFVLSILFQPTLPSRGATAIMHKNS